jgi:hypothetical protein
MGRRMENSETSREMNTAMVGGGEVAKL